MDVRFSTSLSEADANAHLVFSFWGGFLLGMGIVRSIVSGKRRGEARKEGNEADP